MIRNSVFLQFNDNNNFLKVSNRSTGLKRLLRIDVVVTTIFTRIPTLDPSCASFKHLEFTASPLDSKDSLDRVVKVRNKGIEIYEGFPRVILFKYEILGPSWVLKTQVYSV